MNVERIFDDYGKSCDEIFVSFVDSQIDLLLERKYNSCKVNAVTSYDNEKDDKA